jgi:hypothetical protein
MSPKWKSPSNTTLTPSESRNATIAIDPDTSLLNAHNQGKYRDAELMSKTIWTKIRTCQKSKKLYTPPDLLNNTLKVFNTLPLEQKATLIARYKGKQEDFATA